MTTFLITIAVLSLIVLYVLLCIAQVTKTFVGLKQNVTNLTEFFAYFRAGNVFYKTVFIFNFLVWLFLLLHY